MLSSVTWSQPGNSVQEPFDAAVVIPTTCRSTLLRAVTSVFRQVGVRRLQVLIGIDVIGDGLGVVEQVLAACPAAHIVTALNLGYSTSARHGGVHAAGDGGSLRTILTYAANSRYVAYLDDDNWFHETHIERLLAAISGRDWAYTLRWFVDPDTLQPLAIDRWESVGPGHGVFAGQFGGFVDPNCLMIDKLKCDAVIRCWGMSMSADQRRRTADRVVFDALRRQSSVGFTGAATSYYVIAPIDEDSAYRLEWIREFRRRVGDDALKLTSVPPAYGQSLPPAYAAKG